MAYCPLGRRFPGESTHRSAAAAAREICRSGPVTAMPRKIRQLIADLAQAGFVQVSGAKGAHRKFRHPRLHGAVILSGKEGEDAHYYQEKQVRNAIREASQ